METVTGFQIKFSKFWTFLGYRAGYIRWYLAMSQFIDVLIWGALAFASGWIASAKATDGASDVQRSLVTVGISGARWIQTRESWTLLAVVCGAVAVAVLLTGIRAALRFEREPDRQAPRLMLNTLVTLAAIGLFVFLAPARFWLIGILLALCQVHDVALISAVFRQYRTYREAQGVA